MDDSLIPEIPNLLKFSGNTVYWSVKLDAVNLFSKMKEN